MSQTVKIFALNTDQFIDNNEAKSTSRFYRAGVAVRTTHTYYTFQLVPEIGLLCLFLCWSNLLDSVLWLVVAQTPKNHVLVGQRIELFLLHPLIFCNLRLAGLFLSQLQECCVGTLGYFLVGEPDFPHTEAILKTLYTLREQKRIDLQFSVGEALACVCAGSLCGLARDPWQAVDSWQQKGRVDGDVMEKILTEVIGNYSTSTAPLVRQVGQVDARDAVL